MSVMDTTPHDARAGRDSVRSRLPLSVDLVDYRFVLYWSQWSLYVQNIDFWMMMI